MPRPNLIHPIDVVIERLDRNEMIMDHDAREAILGPRSTSSNTYTIQAQISWNDRSAPDPQGAGDRERDSGYILLRLFDMNNVFGSGQRLKRGDRIVQIGNTTGLDLYITKDPPIGHWPDQFGETMIKYHFEDRRPVRQTGDL